MNSTLRFAFGNVFLEPFPTKCNMTGKWTDRQMNACSYRVATEGQGLKRNKKYLENFEPSNHLWFSFRLAKPARERTRLAAYLYFRMEWTPQVVFTKMRLPKLLSMNEYQFLCIRIMGSSSYKTRRISKMSRPGHASQVLWRTKMKSAIISRSDSVSGCGIKTRKYHQSGSSWPEQEKVRNPGIGD